MFGVVKCIDLGVKFNVRGSMVILWREVTVEVSLEGLDFVLVLMVIRSSESVTQSNVF